MSSARTQLLALPETNYLNSENGLKSLVPSTQDHKRIALLYLFTTVFFFVIGGTAAAIDSLGILFDPRRRPRFRQNTYNKAIFYSWHHYGVLFLGANCPGSSGQFSDPADDRRQGQWRSCESISSVGICS